MDWEVFYQRFREPDFIPGYEIQNRLGSGAFGEVFKARKHSIGKAYAIKFLKVDDEHQRAAIERELEHVRHFAAIDHPNLVTIEDMGTVLGVPFLIMGYAGEETLARKLRGARLAEDEALSIFVQVSRGVLALHDRRLVHFDLKPGNVFLKGDVARVGDYGLSKLMTTGRATLSFGRGTPHYMAPEILRSRADHRADIYSLGVVLYECLAGKVPFEATTPGGLVLREPEQPPVFGSDFSAELRPVVERCLEIDPTLRFESVEELLVALNQTARPGDSIRLGPRPAVAPVNGREHGPPAATDPAEPVGELRSTAAELARGAAEVARGVWDGLRSAGGSGRVAESGRPSAPARTPSASRGERQARRTPPPIPRAAPTPPPLPLPLRSEALVASASTRRPLIASAPLGAAPALAGAGTIPVPPRTRRGALGALTTALAIGIELFTSILVGMARVIARGFGYARGRASRGGGGPVRRFLRFVLILALLALAGAAVLSMVMLLAQGTLGP